MGGKRRPGPEGYIVPEADLANVQPEYRGVPETAAERLAATHVEQGLLARFRRACRIASKRMVQAGFAVAMARDGVWATVLEEQALGRLPPAP